MKTRVKIVSVLYNVNCEPDFLTSIIECSEDEMDNACYPEILQEAINHEEIYFDKTAIMFFEWDLERFPWLIEHLNQYEIDDYCRFVEHTEMKDSGRFCNHPVYADGFCKYHHPYYSLTDKEKFYQGWERIFGRN